MTSPLVNNLCVYMRNYQLPAGHVRMSSFDTGAVVGVILRFIERGNKISRSKLECQMLLLEVLNDYSGNGSLFDWTFDTRNGRPNLESFLIFMEKRELISCRNRYYSLSQVGRNLIASLSQYFYPSVLNLIDRVSNFLSQYSATEAIQAVREINRRIMGKGRE